MNENIEQAPAVIQDPVQLTVDMMLSVRRCTRECWLRYHDEETKALQEKNIQIKNEIPKKDTVLYLQDDKSPVSFVSMYVPKSPDASLFADICFCTVHRTGRMALMVCNHTLSYEEQRLSLAFAHCALLQEKVICYDGLIKSPIGGSCELITIDSADINAVVHHLKHAYRVITSSKPENPKCLSSMCDHCLMAERCLPDEDFILDMDETWDNPDNPVTARQLYAAKSDREPLYITNQGTKVGITQNRLTIKNAEGMDVEKPIGEVSQLIIMGNIQVTTQAIHKCCQLGIPVLYLTRNANFTGITINNNIGVHNAVNLAEQILLARDPKSALLIAKNIVRYKIRNQRVLIQRNMDDDNTGIKKTMLERMMRMANNTEKATAINELMGLEGNAATYYFSCYSGMVNAYGLLFMNGRSRRPPKDPVNAMLSFGYALLLKDVMCAILREGLSPWIGFMHTQRSNKPALALDLMEEFRPCIVDSLILRLISQKVVKMEHFDFFKAKNIDGTEGVCKCLLNDNGRKFFLEFYEKKMNTMIKHPVFKTKTSWRGAIHLQLQILCKLLRKDLKEYHPIEIK